MLTSTPSSRTTMRSTLARASHDCSTRLTSSGVSTKSSRASECSKTYAACSAVLEAYTGTITPPAACIPSAALIHSTRLGAYTHARSPLLSPAVAAKSATSRICFAKAPQVTTRQSPLPSGSMKRGRVLRSASVSNTARGAIFSSRYGVMSMTVPSARRPRSAGLELLLEVHDAALQLVEQVQGRLLIALGE